MMATRAIVLGLLAFGCVRHPSVDQGETSPEVGSMEVAAALRCAPVPPGALARLPEIDSCGLALVEEDQAWAVVRVEPIEDSESPSPAAPALARGPGPAACTGEAPACELDGVVTSLGPIIVASVPGPESEVPTQIWLGWVAGEQLVFVESWHGLPSVVDHTRVGPAWALAPFDCKGELALLPAPRLPEAEHETPDDALLAAAGVWQVDASGEAQPPSPGQVAPEGCAALLAHLP